MIPKSNIATTEVPTCPVCSSREFRHLYDLREHEYTNTTDDAFPLNLCDECETAFLSPRPADESLGIIYPPDYYSFDYHKPSTAPKKRALYTRLSFFLFQRRMKPVLAHTRLDESIHWLDVGCGSGAMMELIHEVYGCRVSGIDLHLDHVETKSPHFTWHAGDFVTHDFGDERFDVIFSSQLIEHLASPPAYLDRCRQLLKTGGVAIFATPNHATWIRRMWGRHWGGYHAPRHWVLLGEKALAPLAERANMELCGVYYSSNAIFWSWSFHAWLRALGLRRVADLLFVSDKRAFAPTFGNIFKSGVFTLLDYVIVFFTRRSGNMTVVMRKPKPN